MKMEEEKGREREIQEEEGSETERKEGECKVTSTNLCRRM